MRRRCTFIFKSAVLAAAVGLTGACGIFGGAKEAARSPLLRMPPGVKQVNADGGVITLREADLTPFQRMARERIPAGQKIDRLFTLEADVPAGDGTEGAYIAIYQSPRLTEFCYFEQQDHRPRTDRYFHRPLSAEEAAALAEFVAAHPVEALRVVRPGPAPGRIERLSAPPPAAEEDGAEWVVEFRWTDARPTGAWTIPLAGVSPEDHPAIDLLTMLSGFRDARPGLVCTYLRSIPLNATVLFADPQRRVVRAWVGGNGDDVRAVIVPPLLEQPSPPPAGGGRAGRPPRGGVAVGPRDGRADGGAGGGSQSGNREGAGEEAEDHWYAYQGGRWVPSSPPPLSEETPPPPSATAPGAAAATATQPAGGDDVGLLPQTETWAGEPGDGFTTVWHYLPIDASHGQWLGFVVPGLVFDDANMFVDAGRQLLYTLHDGQLIALPIPPAALVLK